MKSIKVMSWIVLFALRQSTTAAVTEESYQLATDYFLYKQVKYICYLSCDTPFLNKQFVQQFMAHGIRVSVKDADRYYKDLEKILYQWTAPVAVLIDGSCEGAQRVLDEASKATLFDAVHIWMVLTNIADNETIQYTDIFRHLNLSVDADIVAVSYEGDRYKLTDVFNFGKIQGNNLEKNLAGTWRRETGLEISLEGFKYYDRWDFHNLTLRAVSVILDQPKVFSMEMVSDMRYTPGISAMTKIVAQLLDVLAEQHNFRFNFTIAGRWVGSPQRNSSLAVTNSLYWREQDISYTCLRVYPKWLEWVDPIFPPATMLETKFYYLIPEKGVGDYENRFLTPMSPGVWWCSCAAGVACALVLTVAAAVEYRPQPGLYAVGSVLAALCQQAYEDGVQLLDHNLSSQGRRLAILVVGLTSMLLYNYYTSSVVSWLLNAAAPTIASMEGLINSDLKLIFEDIGYTRGWLDNPGFYYYSGFKNPIEDELRDKKVMKAKRTVALMQSVRDGIELVRTGDYAYHSEPYTASQVISRRFDDRELCELGALQMMPPSPVYVMSQKRSPYRKFFIWSMMRLLERGHMTASRARVGGQVPPCSGSTPRALALGQAAPAFALLSQAALLATVILFIEILWSRREVVEAFNLLSRTFTNKIETDE